MSQNITHSFWKNKKVLVTGHTGFKGGWLSLWLKQLGADVIGLSLEPNTKPNLFEEAKVADGMTSIIGDITDLKTVLNVFEKHNPEIIFHLAAQPLVRQSYKDPIKTYTTNIIGTAHILEAVRLSKSAKVLVSITSDKCYENKEWERPYHEEDALGGHDPYSSSKACAEIIIDAYRRSYFYEGTGKFVASVRAGNVIGGGDWSDDRLIPDLIKGLYSKNIITIRNPRATRPWQHVLEPLSGYLMTAEKLYTDGNIFASAWNFGPDVKKVKDVEQVITELEASLGMKIPWVIDNAKNNPHEAKLLQLDSAKAHKYLHWSPKLTVSEAIETTADWYKAFYEGQDITSFTMDQIKDYTNK
ncbi:MAG: CDP-glucose 4,6-dehydratase [Candidatus Levybacteria bacterium]|nr:CDP-glucose 4,6-dehydratase [Candidatus Levybacteria bacterium]